MTNYDLERLMTSVTEWDGKDAAPNGWAVKGPRYSGYIRGSYDEMIKYTLFLDGESCGEYMDSMYRDNYVACPSSDPEVRALVKRILLEYAERKKRRKELKSNRRAAEERIASEKQAKKLDDRILAAARATTGD